VHKEQACKGQRPFRSVCDITNIDSCLVALLFPFIAGLWMNRIVILGVSQLYLFSCRSKTGGNIVFTQNCLHPLLILHDLYFAFSGRLHFLLRDWARHFMVYGEKKRAKTRAENGKRKGGAGMVEGKKRKGRGRRKRKCLNIDRMPPPPMILVICNMPFFKPVILSFV
jgi:hypothetical protein